MGCGLSLFGNCSEDTQVTEHYNAVFSPNTVINFGDDNKTDFVQDFKPSTNSSQSVDNGMGISAVVPINSKVGKISAPALVKKDNASLDVGKNLNFDLPQSKSFEVQNYLNLKKGQNLLNTPKNSNFYTIFGVASGLFLLLYIKKKKK